MLAPQLDDQLIGAVGQDSWLSYGIFFEHIDHRLAYIFLLLLKQLVDLELDEGVLCGHDDTSINVC